MSEKVLLKMIDDGLRKAITDDHPDVSRSVKSWCIYKVEQNLKKVHEESTFHPKLVSIGPFHHNKSEHLKLMEQHKWRFFLDFLKSMKLTASTAGATTSTTTTDDDTIIMTKKRQFLVAAMEKLEDKPKACYSETFDNLGSNEFRMMMLLDGCFIIQLLVLFQKSGNSCGNNDDPMCTWRSTLQNLRHDLLLLENQLPFIVLHQIFEISGIDKKEYKLTDLILKFFNPVLFRENTVLDKCKKQKIFSNDTGHNHLLHLFMSSFQIHQDEDQHGSHKKEEDQHSSIELVNPCSSFVRLESQRSDVLPFQQENRHGEPLKKIKNQHGDTGHHDQHKSIHCVTELREAGIEFKKRDHYDLLQIEFSRGSFNIPTLFIDHITVPVLLNFIAYEQRHHSIKPYFTSYLMFLDYLVNSSKDVEHLHYKGIINHGLGSDEEVAALFNKLCKEVVQDLGDNNYLSPVFKDVNQYFGKRRNRWRAAWKHEYFRTPWAFSSFLAAIGLIVLTFLQTFFTMYAYFHPPSN